MEAGFSSGSQSSVFVRTTVTAQEEVVDEEQKETQEGSQPCERCETRESVSTCNSGFWMQDIFASFEMRLADQHSLDSLVGFYLLPDILGGVLLIFQCHHATAEAAGSDGLGIEEKKQVMLYLWLFATALTWSSVLLSFPFVVLAGFLVLFDGFKVHLFSIATRALALTFGVGALSMVQKEAFLGAQVLILLMSMAMYRVMCMKLSTIPTKTASEADAFSSMSKSTSSSCAGLSKRADNIKD